MEKGRRKDINVKVLLPGFVLRVLLKILDLGYFALISRQSDNNIKP